MKTERETVKTKLKLWVSQKLKFATPTSISQPIITTSPELSLKSNG